MESGDKISINTKSSNRRVTRQSTKEPEFELKPREPLRRKRKNAEPKVGSVTVVNGSETQEGHPSTENGDEPPKKRQIRIKTEHEYDDADMEVQVGGDDQESDQDEVQNSEDPQPALLIKESSVRLVPLRDVSSNTENWVQPEPLEAEVGLRSRRPIHPIKAGSGMDTEAIKHSRGSSKRDSRPSNIPTTLAPRQDSRTQGHSMKSSMKEYHRKMQEGLSDPSDHVDFARPHRRVMDLNQTSNNILHNKKPFKKGGKTGGSSRISRVILWLFLLSVSLSIGVLAYQRIPWSSLRGRSSIPLRHMSLEDSVGVFSDQMSVLEQRFQGQRGELWRRSRIHLQRHLQAAEHTEPVSVILTAGRSAERTLKCLAVGLASAFSSAVNGSVLELDGASLADKDSNEVKLDLDNQLREAFEGDKPAAIIHRLEELPPRSTLIFYRYCDHENAAYKHPLLVFTVLLPQDHVGPEVSLQELEEKVHDHIHKKFLVPDQSDAFDRMDVNKLSGLWSRISHLILPVSMEQHVEEGSCGRS